MDTLSVINLILSFILSVITAIYTSITYKIYKSSNSPILFLKPFLKDTHGEWDKNIMKGLGDENSNIRGLSRIDIEKMILFTLVNNGTGPAYNISFKYEIVTFKNEITFGIDEADVKSYQSVIYKKVVRNIHFDYLAPESEVSFPLIFVSNYPKIEVYATNLESQNSIFINKKLKVYEYKNSDYIELGDSQDYRMMIGV